MRESHDRDVDRAVKSAREEENEAILLLKTELLNEGEKQDLPAKDKMYNLEEKQLSKRQHSYHVETDNFQKELQELKSYLVNEGEEEINLNQEMSSLQLVVEMRTGEVKNLREQLARATQQLEQADVVKGKLGKATARMEDLEEQIKIKNKLEK